jgi:hypothetical protein
MSAGTMMMPPWNSTLRRNATAAPVALKSQLSAERVMTALIATRANVRCKRGKTARPAPRDQAPRTGRVDPELVLFVGPYFHFALGPTKSWTWTTDRFWLDVLPGIVAVLGGLMLLGAGPRPSGKLKTVSAISSGSPKRFSGFIATATSMVLGRDSSPGLPFPRDRPGGLRNRPGDR